MSSTFCAPVGHYSHTVALLLADYTGHQLCVDPPDPDIQDPVLSSPDGFVLKSTTAIVKHLCHDSNTKGLYYDLGELLQSQVDQWLDFCQGLAGLARQWIPPFSHSQQFTEGSRAAAKEELLKQLEGLERGLAGRTFLVGEAITLADIVLAECIRPLLESVLGEQDRKPFSSVVRWLTTCCSQPPFTKVTGGLRLSSKPNGWIPPQVSPTMPLLAFAIHHNKILPIGTAITSRNGRKGLQYGTTHFALGMLQLIEHASKWPKSRERIVRTPFRDHTIAPQS